MPTMRFAGLPLLLVGLLALPGASLRAEDKPEGEKSTYEFRRDHDPDGIGKFYMGREIAQVMGHLAAGWLERAEREQEEKTSKLLPALKINPGDVVVDLGAGSGYYTFPLAKLVGE